NDVQVFQIAKMAGAILAARWRSVLGHVLSENIAWRNTFDQQRANIANHGRQPIFLFECVRGANGNAFLAFARIQAAHNFVLAEKLHHGVFHGAVQAHVVIQVQILLPRKFFLHPRSLPVTLIKYYDAISTACALARFCSALSSCVWSCASKSSRDVSRISNPNTSPKFRTTGCTTSLRVTARPRIFSSEVALHPVMPQGTIKSKLRKSVDTL